jgi:hypothetical protein
MGAQAVRRLAMGVRSGASFVGHADATALDDDRNCRPVVLLPPSERRSLAQVSNGSRVGPVGLPSCAADQVVAAGGRVKARRGLIGQRTRRQLGTHGAAD